MLLKQGRKRRLSLAIEELAARSIDSIERIDFEQQPLIEHNGQLLPFHKGQKEVWDSAARIIAAFKGWQAGGTVIGAPWLLREMQRCGPGDYALLAPTQPLMDSKALPSLLKTFRGLVRRSGNELAVTPDGAAKIWGDVHAEGRIVLRTGTDPNSIEAFTAKAVWIDEGGQLSDAGWEAVLGRAAVHQARVLITSRPYRRNFYVREIWEACRDAKGQHRPNAPAHLAAINFRSIDNPTFPTSEYYERKAKMPEWRFLMKYDGIPTKPAGVIYDTYRTTPRVPIGPDWPRAAGHDFGKLNMAGVWAARHPTRKNALGRPVWIVYSTYLAGNRSAKEHAERFVYGMNPAMPEDDPKKREPGLWRVGRSQDWAGRWTPVMPLAWGGNATSEQGWRWAFDAEGYPIGEPPISGVQEGIENLYAMLKTGEIEVFEDLANLIGDLDNYSTDVDEEGEPDQDKIQDKAKWHRMDGLRYLAVGLASAGPAVIISGRKTNGIEEEGDGFDDERDGQLGGSADPGPATGLSQTHDVVRAKPSRVVSGSVRGRSRVVVRHERASNGHV